MNTWAIVPVKSFHQGKSRLSTVLSAEKRLALTKTMFRHVITVLKQVSAIDKILVVSRDQTVAELANEFAVTVYSKEQPRNLNVALTMAADCAWLENAQTLLIIPSDLGLLQADDIEMMLAQTGRVAICPDDRFDGTNALLIRNLPRFQFHYGEQSFTKHLEEATFNGHVAQVVYADSIEFDLDTPADWQRYQKIVAGR
ncbi:MAG TPA: 2-phospho-L-lactate guanylyltransferase [Anaerolineae bacterium]|nr:2-phospho-L-lactate guanylyltransferase [Anaerolineae bacterium]